MSGEGYRDGDWVKHGGTEFSSINPATGETIWRGASANADDVNKAVDSARKAFPAWASKTVDGRLAILTRFKVVVESRKEALTETLAQETGKALWDSRSEITSMIAKLGFVVDAYHERTGVKLSEGQGFKTVLRHRPHGVVAVFGPYNFPAHLPNGHMLPALLAGNCVVFKPSELTPLIAEKTLECWHEAGVPKGIVNLVQGERDTGKLLSQHPDIDGLFFTGSSETGKILHRQFSESPQKILALELGGNNPLVVHEVADAKAAAYLTIQSAYITSGQRCTCSRRLIVPESSGNDRYLEELVKMVSSIQVGAYNQTPEPFMGPLINNKEAEKLLQAQDDFLKAGGKALVTMKRLHENLPFISPALIDVTNVTNRPDKEWFGPLLQVIRVKDMHAALVEANKTQYGLSSGIFTDNKEHYDYFLTHVHAGVVNWNRPLTGSSANLPFGGVGMSGNHRPAAYYASDYCAYPVSSNEALTPQIPASVSPGLTL